jgi:hypothetical protein
VHDLVLAKCVAGRERDWEYAREALKAGLVEPALLLGRIPDLPVPDALRHHVKEMLQSIICDAA